MISTMTAMTILLKKGFTESIKEEALRLAEMYSGNIQIQIDIKRDDSIALMRITEYNI